MLHPSLIAKLIDGNDINRLSIRGFFGFLLTIYELQGKAPQDSSEDTSGPEFAQTSRRLSRLVTSRIARDWLSLPYTAAFAAERLTSKATRSNLS